MSPDSQLITDAHDVVEAVDSQDGLDRAYSKVATLLERGLVVRYDLVTDGGKPDPAMLGGARNSGSSP